MNSTAARRIWVAISLLLAVALLASLVWHQACQRWEDQTSQEKAATQAKEEARATAMEPLTVRIAMKWFFAGTMAPYFAAQSNDVFKNAGLRVDLLQGGPSAPSIDQVLLGKAEFGITGAHDLAMARSKDQPLIAVAVIFRRSPTCIVTLASSGLTKPEHLAEKTIELTRGDNSEFEVLAMLAKNKATLPQAKRPLFRFNYDALKAGHCDGAVAYENDQAISLAREVKINVIAPADYGVTPYADVLFTTEGLITSHPELVARTVNGMLAAWIWAFDNVDDCVARFVEHPQIKKLNLDKDLQKLVLHKSITFVRGQEPHLSEVDSAVSIGLQDLQRWEETISLIRQYSREPYSKFPDASSCFSNQWAQLFKMRAVPKSTDATTR